MTEHTLEMLDEKVEFLKTKLNEQISELVEVIVGDIPAFTLRQIRRAFIEDVDFSEQKTDAELSEFKARVHAFGEQLATDVRASLLENPDLWRASDIDLANAGKTLDGNTKIAEKFAVIPKRIAEFLVNEHIAPIEVVYKTPAYFINGKYTPGLIEKYWARLGELRAAEEERAVVDKEARKARLAQRWDEI